MKFKLTWDKIGYYLLCITTWGFAWMVRATLTIAIKEGLKRDDEE